MQDSHAPPLDLPAVRKLAWIALLAFAVVQAWAARFTSSPDGISYLDLSDAVVAGHWGGLVNAYWSPLYPALIGLMRLAFRPNAYWEFAVVHLLNLLLFVASIAAFEYFLDPLRRLAVTWGRPELQTPAGCAAAYAFFGVFSLTMTPLGLPTPDLAVSTTVFVVLGALLRLHYALGTPRTPIALGLALGAGSLAKSFLIPWSIVCLITVMVATRRRDGLRPTIMAKLPWVAIVVPWCVILSVHVGRPTFGETGHLTYVWAMNFGESPSNQAMPRTASTPTADSLLPGLAITPHAEGTNPVWLDPARWYGDLPINWNLDAALRVFAKYLVGYVTAFGPLVLLLWLGLVAADPEVRAAAWRRGWVVGAPALIALVAYALVLVTTRYIAPFVIAGILVMWVALPWPARLMPKRVFAALVIACLVTMAASNGQPVLASQASIFAAVLAAWIVRRGSTTRTIVIAVLAWAIVRLLVWEVPGATDPFVLLWAAAVAAVAAGSVRRQETREFSRFTRMALGIASCAVLGLAAGWKYYDSVANASMASAFGVENLPWAIASDLRDHGITPGLRVAVVGSPFDSYWARSASVQIVGVVPQVLFAKFWTLPLAKREAVIAEFAKGGAQAVVALIGPEHLEKTDSTWVPTKYHMWVRLLDR